MLASLIQALAVGEATGAAKRVRRALIDYAIAGVLLSIGAGFFLAAGYIYASRFFDPLHVALGFGGGFVLLALIAVLTHRIMSGMQAKRRAQEERTAQMKSVAIAAALTALPALLKSRIGIMGILSPIIAMAAYAIIRENAPSSPDQDD
jgi:Na+/pantothenate symporter